MIWWSRASLWCACRSPCWRASPWTPRTPGRCSGRTLGGPGRWCPGRSPREARGRSRSGWPGDDSSFAFSAQFYFIVGVFKHCQGNFRTIHSVLESFLMVTYKEVSHCSKVSLTFHFHIAWFCPMKLFKWLRDAFFPVNQQHLHQQNFSTWRQFTTSLLL